MKLRHWVLVLMAVVGLTLSGCGGADPTPPPDAVTDTPMLDIDDGSEVAPDQIKTEGDAAADAAGGADAAGEDQQ